MKCRFLALGFAALSLGSCGKKAASTDAGRGEERAVPVVVVPAVKAVVARRVRVRCAIRSRYRVQVSPKVPGVLVDVPLEAGDQVREGKTVLLKTDSKIPFRALEAARAGLRAAQRGLEEARAALGAARAAEAKARLDRDRLARLLEAGRSVTKDAAEKARVAWKAAAAGLERARAAVGVARAGVDQAQSRVSIAEQRVEDCTVRAPMDGVVTRKFMEKGEMGDVGRPVFAVENPERLEAAGFLEASLYGDLAPGKTLVRILRKGREIFRGPLSWKAPSVRADLRVFEVRLYLPSGFTRAASGELLTMEAVLWPHEALTVPTKAVVFRGEKPTVFLARKGMARLVVLKTGVVDGERTEVLGGDLREGEEVVVRGQAFLEEGRAVKARRAGKGG